MQLRVSVPGDDCAVHRPTRHPLAVWGDGQDGNGSVVIVRPLWANMQADFSYSSLDGG